MGTEMESVRIRKSLAVRTNRNPQKKELSKLGHAHQKIQLVAGMV